MKIPDLYQVKWRKTESGKYRYGIVSTYGEDSQSEWDNNRNLTINDAITPLSSLVNYDSVDIVPIKCTFDNEYELYVEAERVKAQEKSNSVSGLVHKMFTVGVCDGNAHYVVTKENKKTVKIEWRGFCPDRYFDAFLGYGGTFEKDRIATLIHQREGLAKLFAGKGLGV